MKTQWDLIVKEERKEGKRRRERLESYVEKLKYLKNKEERAERS